MSGSVTATDRKPPPPISDISKAPPRGNCSAVMPIIVGHRKVLPTPNSVAASSATAALELLSSEPSQ